MFAIKSCAYRISVSEREWFVCLASFVYVGCCSMR